MTGTAAAVRNGANGRDSYREDDGNGWFWLVAGQNPGGAQLSEDPSDGVSKEEAENHKSWHVGRKPGCVWICDDQQFNHPTSKRMSVIEGKHNII